MPRYTILKGLNQKLINKVQSFQRKFNKYGEGFITFQESAPYRCVDKKSPYYNRVVIDVDIEGQYIIQGYEFVATLEWRDSIQRNIIKAAPGSISLPERFLTSNTCEHCKTDRYRKYTVVLYNKELDRFIQVGKSCVKDFIGCDVSLYASYLAWWTSIEEYCEALNKENIGSTSCAFDLKYVCEQTCAEIRSHGFISKKMSIDNGENITSTARRITLLLNKDHDRWGDLIVPEYDISNEDTSIASNFIESVKQSNPTSTYEWNVKSIGELGYVEGDFSISVVVSALGIYIRKLEQQRVEKELAKKSVSDFVGQVGDRIELKNVQPECLFSTESSYGYYYKYRFVLNGNIVIWGTSKELDADSLITLKGTIKNHNTYKGIKQTEITNCRITEEKKLESTYVS